MKEKVIKSEIHVKRGKKTPKEKISPEKNNLIHLARLYPSYLEEIEEQDHEICLEAVKSHGIALAYVRNQTADICEEAVKNDGRALAYVDEKFMTDNLCLEALGTITRYTADIMKSIPEKFRTKQLIEAAVKKNGIVLRYLKPEEITYELCLEAVKTRGNVITDYNFKKEYLTDELCLEAVKNDPGVIEFIENQTEEICFEAVRRNPFTIKSIKNQTEKLCLEAVKGNGHAWKFINNPTEKVTLEAVKTAPSILEYVKDFTEEICLEAIKVDPNAIRFSLITPRLVVEAVTRNANAINWVNPNLNAAFWKEVFNLVDDNELIDFIAGRINWTKKLVKMLESDGWTFTSLKYL